MDELEKKQLDEFLARPLVVSGARVQVEKQEAAYNEIEMLLSKNNRLLSTIQRHIPSIATSQILIASVPADEKEVLVVLAQQCLLEHKTPVLVLFSTNYKTMQELLTEAKVPLGKVILIDTVSKGISRVSETSSVLFVDSLRNLTQLQIKAVTLVEQKKDLCFIFDSLCTLELYHTEDIILKFFYSFTKILHKKKVPGMYLVCQRQATPKVIQFFDDFFEIPKH